MEYSQREVYGRLSLHFCKLLMWVNINHLFSFFKTIFLPKLVKMYECSSFGMFSSFLSC
eukprot:c41698_g1_i1 orf=273-449(+)